MLLTHSYVASGSAFAPVNKSVSRFRNGENKKIGLSGVRRIQRKIEMVQLAFPFSATK
jgi:hypothetical protein